jgi:diketogulonate reductase-like aldo/keto reductase
VYECGAVLHSYSSTHDTTKIACQHDVQAVQKSGIAREEIFITTKIHPRHLGYQAALRAFESSLRNFATDFIDLVLLHYAECWGTLCDRKPEGDWKESWRALEELVVSGKVLAIGAFAHPPR